MPQQPQQQQQHKPPKAANPQSLGALSLDAPATNLTNLASLDNANFFIQQQQLRMSMAAAAAAAAATAANAPNTTATATASSSSSSSSSLATLPNLSSNSTLPNTSQHNAMSSTECLATSTSTATSLSSSTNPTASQPTGGGYSSHRARQVSQSRVASNLSSATNSSQQSKPVSSKSSSDFGTGSGVSTSSSSNSVRDSSDDVQSLTSTLNLCSLAVDSTPAQQHIVPISQPQPPLAYPLFAGHHFSKRTFHKPTYCHHCADMLWGFVGQGFGCDVCNFVVHERCMKSFALNACSALAASFVRVPTPHCWLDDCAVARDSSLKRKTFCNVCRKRVNENDSTRANKCGVCEYTAHAECVEFALANCRECATNFPGRRLATTKQTHHWLEGNLPPSSSVSKCVVCRKSCWSVECLTGARCAWCLATAHATCAKQLPRECSLGALASILLPPFCVTVPRADVPVETIIGAGGSKLFAPADQLNASLLSSTQHLLAPSNALYISQQATDVNPNNLPTPTPTPTPTPIASTALTPATALPSSQQQPTPSSSSATISSSSDTESGNLQTQLTSLYNIESQTVEFVRVFDGNGGLKRRNFRWLSINTHASKDQLVSACLTAFHTHDDDISQYALVDVSELVAGWIVGEQQQQTTTSTNSNNNNINTNHPETCSFNQTLACHQTNQQQQPSVLSSIQISSQTPSQLSTLSGINLLNEKELDLSHEQYPLLVALKRLSDRKLHSSLLLRFKPHDSTRGTIKVYSGKLAHAQQWSQFDVEHSSGFTQVQVTSDTSVDDVLQMAAQKFCLSSASLASHRLVEVSLGKASAVHERTMDSQECPWELIKNLARESIRDKENVRFYIQQKDEVYCSSVAIYVGNLPTNLSQKLYEQMLVDILGKPYRFKSINPIYYEYGSCIITYDNPDIAVKAFRMLRDANVKLGGDDSRALTVLLLPNIAPEMIPNGVRPLLVFVNVKSGGCQGVDLITSFRRLLNPYQVYDLDNGGPLAGLYVFRRIRDYRILVSGGDGSVGWVLQCLDNVGQDSECQSPPCAIIPLGTGNDLARVLRWGSGFTGAEDPINFLKDIIDAEEVILDRWTVVFRPDESTTNKPLLSSPALDNCHYLSSFSSNLPSVSSAIAISTPTTEDNTVIMVMNNYLGIGIDADLCLGFHNAREENPNKFNSRFHNKGVYVKQAIRKMVNRKWNNFSKDVRLEVDGKIVQLPHLEGIIVLNILSWGSGANPWGPETEDRFAKPTHHDGMLEVVGVTGIVHIGQIQSGLSRGIRIAQGARIKMRLSSEMPVQVDGEPWVQAPCEVNIIRSALKATMLRKIKMKRRNTEPSINQEQQQQQQTNKQQNEDQ